MPLLHNNEKLKDRRRELRQRLTKEEKILWLELRDSKLGYKFKRQHSIGGYILDFYCSECKLIVEIDGASHSNAEAREYDKVRDTYFRELGYKTVRFLNEEIKKKGKEKIKKKNNFFFFSPRRIEGGGGGGG